MLWPLLQELMILKTHRLNLYLALCAILILPATTLSAEDTPGGAGSISFMIGDVHISSDEKKWHEADFDVEIMDGMYIKTGEDALCEITLADETIVRMDGNSTQRIEKSDAQPAAKEKSVLLIAGKVWVNARKMLSKGDSFKVRTNKAVCAIRGTIFSVAESETHTQVRVHKGKVATWSSLLGNKPDKPEGAPIFLKPVPVEGPHPVSMKKWVEIIEALQQISIDTDGGYERQDFNPKTISEDPWVAWNMRRDESVSKQ